LLPSMVVLHRKKRGGFVSVVRKSSISISVDLLEEGSDGVTEISGLAWPHWLNTITKTKSRCAPLRFCRDSFSITDGSIKVLAAPLSFALNTFFRTGESLRALSASAGKALAIARYSRSRVLAKGRSVLKDRRSPGRFIAPTSL
jgi:hypothetical protein